MANQPRPRSLRNTLQNYLVLLLLPGFLLAGCSQHHVSGNVPLPPAPSSNPGQSTYPTAGTTAPDAPRRNPPATTQPNNVPPNDMPPNAHGWYIEQGFASWYGVPYHGRRAANGEIYDMYKMTAAHRTLPFNTVVRVTNLTNMQTVDVRITDRGPFVEDRIIDLSLAAARAIDMVMTGTARVRVETISAVAATNPATGNFSVQVGAFADRVNAERLKDQLSARYQPIQVKESIGPNGRLYRLRVGSVPTEAAAKQLAEKLHLEDGFDTFVVRLDEVQVRGGTEQ
jgi:rare lipoprotein A